MDTSNEGLRVDQVHVWRGDRHVLQGVSLRLGAGELVHVLGPNGSGKTTLLRIVAGLSSPEQGVVTWRGAGIARVRADYQRSLAYAAHEPALKGDLTALENLHFAVALKRRTTARELRIELERVGVAECADLPARVLSAGQKRRVAMARLVAVRAALWLLDEPYTNLDTAGSALLSGLLEAHAAAGGMALVVAHHDLAINGHSRQLALGA